MLKLRGVPLWKRILIRTTLISLIASATVAGLYVASYLMLVALRMMANFLMLLSSWVSG